MISYPEFLENLEEYKINTLILGVHFNIEIKQKLC